jgi:AcrR family transcriptional regulator
LTSTGTGSGTAGAAPRRGRTDKAEAIVRAAREVFGRDGYSRAAVDTIAAEAGASTRTLYNHFPGGKGELFRAAVRWSSGRLRDAQLASLHRYLDHDRLPRREDLERDLLALSRAWTELLAGFRSHFLLVRHIYAEAGHVPPEVLEVWQETGPRAVGRELTDTMAALEAHGLLDTHGDPAQAAAHFMTLTSADVLNRSYWGANPLPQTETDRLTAAGVRAFLRAYGPTG